MKLFLASLTKHILEEVHKRFPEKRINILRSFGVPHSEDYNFFHTHRDMFDKLMYDCGCFTLNNPQASQEAKDRVKSETYLEQVLNIQDQCDYISSFDPDWSDDCIDTNLYYYTKLKKAGVKNLFPVIHNPRTEVNCLIDMGVEMVAIGSVLIRRLDAIGPIVRKLHKAGIKVHFFGTTTFAINSQVPIYSCDSASWAKTGSFGEIIWWNPYKEVWDPTEKVYMEEYIHLDKQKTNCFSTYKYLTEFEEYLWNTFKFTHEDFFGKKRHQNLHLVNTYYYLQLEDRINEEQQKRGLLVE